MVLYAIWTLVIETLRAFVARRDASTGTLANIVRQINVLSESGVGKGNYLGIFPTLIWCLLVALNLFLLHDGATIFSEVPVAMEMEMEMEEMKVKGAVAVSRTLALNWT